jgi:hypothetical protein
VGGGTAKVALRGGVGGGGAMATVATVAGTACVTFSALTKVRSPWVLHSLGSALPWGQQWCFCAARRTCGQEKQFPQKSATTTSAAMTELKAARISILMIHDYQVGIADFFDTLLFLA